MIFGVLQVYLATSGSLVFLKLFFFAILVQEFEIKVENLCVVRFLPLPVRRVLLPWYWSGVPYCRSPGYIIYSPPPHNTKKNTLQHTPHICRGESCQLFSKVILDNAVHVKFDTIRCAWQHPRKSLPDAEEFKNLIFLEEIFLANIPNIAITAKRGSCRSL